MSELNFRQLMENCKPFSSQFDEKEIEELIAAVIWMTKLFQRKQIAVDDPSKLTFLTKERCLETTIEKYTATVYMLGRASAQRQMDEEEKKKREESTSQLNFRIYLYNKALAKGWALVIGLDSNHKDRYFLVATSARKSQQIFPTTSGKDFWAFAERHVESLPDESGPNSVFLVSEQKCCVVEAIDLLLDETPSNCDRAKNLFAARDKIEEIR